MIIKEVTEKRGGAYLLSPHLYDERLVVDVVQELLGHWLDAEVFGEPKGKVVAFGYSRFCASPQ